MFSTDVAASVAHGELQLIAVGTPPGEDGSADLQHVLAAARHRPAHARLQARRHQVDRAGGHRGQVREAVKAETKVPFSVVSNPEFLKEGAAVEDFMRPDRVIIGAEDGAPSACCASSTRRSSATTSASW